jgi:hypothetical protein
MLIPRESVTFGRDSQPVPTPWREWLTDHEQSFLTDNQLSVFVDSKGPGCERVHFYPLPFAHAFTGGRWNFEELVNHDSLRSTGPRLDLPVDEVKLTFRPDRIEKTLRVGDRHIRERCAVHGNTLVIEWDFDRPCEVPLQFALPYFAARSEALDNGLLVSVNEQVFVALMIGVIDADVDHKGSAQRTEPAEAVHAPPLGSWAASPADELFECTLNMRVNTGRLCLALACGYDRKTTVEAAQNAAANPADVFAHAEQMWDDYFMRSVPRFECSDAALERLYYYQAYTTRANLYDIPYEPFTQPYTCPWKTGAVWQWSWNTPLNSVAERWLNDKQIGAGGILLEADNGGALNIGSWLRPLRRATSLRGHNAHSRQVGEYLKAMPTGVGVDMAPLTTLPHTTPNGLLGAWEFYLCSGDKDFLRRALALMVEAEAEFSTHDIGNGLCSCPFIDEFDYSLRLKPFIAGFAKGDPEMMLKMDTPFLAIDYNCYLHALRERMIEATEILGGGADVARLRAANAQLKTAINQRLWNEQDGFYYDADPRDMRHSGVKCIGGFAALYAGIADERQAARLVQHLTDPREFGTPYPCPSISMDTPDVDPALITYGGDCLMTSGLWFTVQGLARYGYRDLAAQYVLKAIEMVNREGPSSSYSYHSITGHYNQGKHTLAAQCTVLTDLLVRYVIGLQPQADGALQVDALALRDSSLQWFRFGPYRYRDEEVEARWERDADQSSQPQLMRRAYSTDTSRMRR